MVCDEKGTTLTVQKCKKCIENFYFEYNINNCYDISILKMDIIYHQIIINFINVIQIVKFVQILQILQAIIV